LQVARYGAFWNSNLRSIYRDFKSPLHTEVVLLVLFATGREYHYRIGMVPPTLSLSEQDKFAFRIHPSAPVYVYIYQFDRDRVVKRLYPPDHKGVALREAATLPGKGVWFNPDGVDGKTVINIVLARWRCRDLEEPSSPEALKQYIASRETAGSLALVQQVGFIRKSAR
jgi:hypothetical protein